MATVSVIIVNYNGGVYLARCLEALFAQSRLPEEVIVADNGSTDGSLEILQKYPAIRVLALGENTGFAKANNLAAKEASGEYTALLNPDAYPEPDWLETLMKAAEKFPNTAMFGSTQLDAKNPQIFDGTGDCYHAFGIPYRAGFGHPVRPLPEYYEVFAPCAAAALYRKDVFLGSGGFDERFFCYCEDVDLGFRLRVMGHSALQISRAIVWHEGSGITGGKSDFTVYHSARNRLWVFVKNMPALLFWVLLIPHLAATLFFGLRFARIGKGKAYAKGVWHAIAGIKPVLHQRKAIQQNRKADMCGVAKRFTWSPLKLLRREIT